MRIITIIGAGVALLIFFSSFYIYTNDVAAVSSVEIGIQKIKIEKVNLINQTFTLNISVNLTNPTGSKIQNLSSTFDIFIESYYIGSGSFQEAHINPHTNTSIPIATTITYKGLATYAIESILNLINEQQTTLHINGTMTAKIFFGLSQTTQEFTAAITTA